MDTLAKTLRRKEVVMDTLAKKLRCKEVVGILVKTLRRKEVVMDTLAKKLRCKEVVGILVKTLRRKEVVMDTLAKRLRCKEMVMDTLAKRLRRKEVVGILVKTLRCEEIELKIIFELKYNITMHENEIAKIIVDCCYKIHVTLGPGLFESVYEEILCYELKKRGLNFQRQQGIPVYYDGVKMGIGFRADVIVENKVVVELKSVQNLHPVDFKQVNTYLKLTGKKLGLLVNFNVALIKDGIKRYVNRL